DMRVAGNGVIDQASENVALCPRAQPLQAVAGRVAWKGRTLVETADDFGALVTRQAQVGNTVRRLESSAAIAARPVGGQRAAARRAGKQLTDIDHLPYVGLCPPPRLRRSRGPLRPTPLPRGRAVRA